MWPLTNVMVIKQKQHIEELSIGLCICTHNKYDEDNCEENGDAGNNWNYNREHHQHRARENRTLFDVRVGG